MKVVLYIGHHKTGSTSLQSYLAENYLKFLRQGILYPSVESQGLAMNLASAATGKDLFVDDLARNLRLNIRVPHNALALRLLSEEIGTNVPKWHPNLPASAQMLIAIRNQIETLAPQTVLICSEVMSRFADRGYRKVLPVMHQAFGQNDCSIILTLRRPDQYLASWHLQRLKFMEQLPPLRAGAQKLYAGNVHFRFDWIVERWREYFTDAKMHVHNYDNVVNAGGSVVDFFSTAGIDHVPTSTAKHMNSSVPYAFAEIVRLSIQASPEIAHKMIRYIRGVTNRVAYPENKEVELFGENNRLELYNAFKPVNTALNQHLGTSAFFPDIEDVKLCRPIPELVAAAQALLALRADAKDNLPMGDLRTFIDNLDVSG